MISCQFCWHMLTLPNDEFYWQNWRWLVFVLRLNIRWSSEVKFCMAAWIVIYKVPAPEKERTKIYFGRKRYWFFFCLRMRLQASGTIACSNSFCVALFLREGESNSSGDSKLVHCNASMLHCALTSKYKEQNWTHNDATVKQTTMHAWPAFSVSAAQNSFWPQQLHALTDWLNGWRHHFRFLKAAQNSSHVTLPSLLASKALRRSCNCRWECCECSASARHAECENWTRCSQLSIRFWTRDLELESLFC